SHENLASASSLILCKICNDLKSSEFELVKTPCSHNFHSECISNWLNTSETCPTCKKPCRIGDIFGSEQSEGLSMLHTVAAPPVS
ncbi:hypothetical protein KR215_004009, partial [Drosophila sulfurigaster]